MRKYRLLRDLLTPDGIFEFIAAPFADPETIAVVHDEEYVSGFLNGRLEAAVQRRIGFPWSQGLVNRTLASVGGTLAAASDAIDCGIGGSLAGGTHHAFRGEGAGFCVFNDIAIAITSLRVQRRIARSVVIDLDVHQGDGTAKIFENDPAVLTISVHGGNNFPFRKQTSGLDIELADGTTDAEYLIHLPAVMERAFAFRPDIVFYQSGVDGLAPDKLGRLSLTHAGLKSRDEMVLSACRTHGVACVITLGGGYSDPIDLTVEAHANTFRTAERIFADFTQSRRAS